MALTIRTTKHQDSIIEDLCSQMDIKTASGLLLNILENYQDHKVLREKLAHDLAVVKRQNEQLKHVIEKHQHSLTSFLDFCVED